MASSQESDERWQKLWEQAANEPNPEKQSELVYEIHRLLREKENKKQPPQRTTDVD